VQLSVRTDTIGTTVVLRVAGAADIASAPALGVQVAELIRRSDCDVVIDLSDTTFLDSTGLSVLLNINRRATRAGLGSAVICPPGPARTPMRIARLEETLRVYDSETDALRCVEDLRSRRAGGTP
jgi:anti-anti-sigma factor